MASLNAHPGSLALFPYLSAGRVGTPLASLTGSVGLTITLTGRRARPSARGSTGSLD
jgi:hypothetical protein